MNKESNSISESGFTLIELMVVIAIIGVLSAVAIPNFKKYQAKSKTTEAKLQLSSAFTAEAAFLSDYDVYASCLTVMGYDPSSESANRYYSIGFTEAFGHDDAQERGATACTDLAPTREFIAGKTLPGAAATAPLIAPAAANSVSAYSLSANGYISAEGKEDTWTINNNKELKNTKVGY